MCRDSIVRVMSLSYQELILIFLLILNVNLGNMYVKFKLMEDKFHID